jgi:anti-anti-sigma regulatory factor
MAPSCELEGGRLRASGDFSRDADTAFDQACQKILEARERELLADLVGVERMSSTYVGLLAELCLGARERGKKLIIRAGPKLAATLREAGLGTAADLEEVG